MPDRDPQAPPVATELPSAETLAQMVRVFNESTAKLEEAYTALQTEVHTLNAELEAANRQLEARVAELTEVKEYLNSVLDSATNGVVAVDLDGCVTAFSSGAERITGHRGDAALGRRYEDVLGVPFGLDLRAARRREAEGEIHYVAGEVIDADGKAVPVHESTALMHNAAGDVIGAVKVFEDLSEIRELQERVRQRDRLLALGEMAATVAHEIRNPLGGIEGFAALLARDIPEDDTRRRLVDQILLGTRSLNRVVTELLLFTRPIQLDFRMQDARPLLDSAWEFVAAQADAARIRLHRAYGDAPVPIRADAEQLRRVFLNLMLNAVQAMPDGGDLYLGIAPRTVTDGDGWEPHEAARLQREWVEVTVRDTGTGIPAAKLAKIFEPFFTTKEKGTGLGLAIALKIVEGHSGWIHAASDETGTTFATYLPRPRQGHGRKEQS